MSSSADWSRAYARQADADFQTWEKLRAGAIEAVPECHRLLFLQMACEKLCKAHLISGGSDPEQMQTSHAYIARSLPVVVRQRIARRGLSVKNSNQLLKAVRHLAQEIELLNPSVRRDGRRPDNCEYPWQDHGGHLHSPLDWKFQPIQLLVAPSGRTFLKLMREAINALL
jgi:hypothetical protein